MSGDTKMLRLTKKIAAAALIATAFSFAGASQAQACNPAPAKHCYQPAYSYTWVTVHETRRVPYTKYVVKYTHCGKPYVGTTTAYKTVTVPVRKRVRVYR